MFMKPHSLLFVTTLMGGTLIALSANSWVTAWLGLEINLMSMIPLLLKDANNKATESAIKYFLPQAMASVILIAATMVNYMISLQLSTTHINFLILVALLIKMGAAPLHFWFPQVLMSSNWTQSLLILTWQKIAPFILLSYFNNSNLILLAVMASAAVGAAGGLNQTSIKLLLTYSSIAHSGWLLILVTLAVNTWLAYFMIYALNTLVLITLTKILKINNIKQLNSACMTGMQKYTILIAILSLGGLPPFLGFYAKLISILTMLQHKMIFILLILLLSSLISLFYYLKMTYAILMMNSTRPTLILATTLMSSTPAISLLTIGMALLPLGILLT